MGGTRAGPARQGRSRAYICVVVRSRGRVLHALDMIRPCRKFERIADPLVHAVAVVLALVLVAGSALAEPAFSFETAPGKLPKTVVPLHYAVDLALNPESRTIVGSEL